MQTIPRETIPDSTLLLARDGYNFISSRCRQFGSDLFKTRLLFEETICVTGADAAHMFYAPERFKRAGVMPRRVQKTLIGEGGVQGLDGDAHRNRKQMLMSLMTPERLQELADLSSAEWRDYSSKWISTDMVVLFEGVQEILTRAVCTWAGLRYKDSQTRQLTYDLGALIEAPVAVGPRHWRGRIARGRLEKWLAAMIEAVRAEKVEPNEGTALHTISWHLDQDGALLEPRVAAVELLNVLRPTVAVARWIVFAAHALHKHPEWRATLQHSDDRTLECFIQEVRRFYPFFPFVGAYSRHDFEWNGYPFPAGTRVLLDLYGTNHDSRVWEAPDEFHPQRFFDWEESPYTFIPQGGGDFYTNHRCAGEWITIELLKVGTAFLTRSLAYDVPDQDLSIRMNRIPAIPKSRFLMTNVRNIGDDLSLS